MKEEQQMDIRYMEDEARASDSGEHYQEMDKNPSFRIGVGARMSSPERPAFFIEVIVNPCPGPGVDLSMMEKNLSVLKELETRGYTMRLEDDGSIVCEVRVQPDDVEAEVDRVTERFCSSI
jgi:hypothetical protein